MSSITLRFLAEPNTVNFGGKVHGGTVMKWIETSMNISVEVRSGDMKGGAMEKTTECLIVFVSVDSHGRPLPVEAYVPGTPGEMALAERARAHLDASRAASGNP